VSEDVIFDPKSIDKHTYPLFRGVPPGVSVGRFSGEYQYASEIRILALGSGSQPHKIFWIRDQNRTEICDWGSNFW